MASHVPARQGRTQDVKLREVGDKRKKKKKSNIHSYSINRLSSKYIYKSFFLNILRCNYLPTITKDTKHY